MDSSKIDFSKIPESPGVYIFKGAKSKILYVGRATELRSRIRSYFSNTLEVSRGKRLVQALNKIKKIETIETSSVLDTYILEANLIKKHQPEFNVVDKDNKSFQFVCITKEDFPRVLIVRGRDLKNRLSEFSHTYGPFPKGSVLKEALKIIRKIFPYRDSCRVYDKKRKINKKCLRAEIGLCPGTCSGDIGKREYSKCIRELRLFFEGKKKQLINSLEKDMKNYAKKKEFEKAEYTKRKLFSLKHIQDVNLIKREFAEGSSGRFRVEGYDVAHIAGKSSVGVMVVNFDGEMEKNEYRVFNIKNAKSADDVGALEEILERRLNHSEWRYPGLVVIDGGKGQLNRAKKIFEKYELDIPIVSVVKDDRHKPKDILGSKEYIHTHEKEILDVNSEAHRFALSRHKAKRKKDMFA